VTTLPAGRPFELDCVPAGCTTVSPDLLVDLRTLADLFGSGIVSGGEGGGGGESGGGGGGGVVKSERADRVDLSEQWRDGLTRLQKLEASLVARWGGAR
jgi:hypothetical protein